MKRILDRATDRFVAAQSTARAFGICAALFAGYCLAGQRIPGTPHAPWFDPYPYPFLVTFVSLWAILLGIAVLKTGKVIENWMDVHIARLEALEERILARLDAIEKEGNRCNGRTNEP